MRRHRRRHRTHRQLRRRGERRLRGHRDLAQPDHGHRRGGIRIGHFFSWETDGSGQLTERGRQRKAAMPKGPHSRRITVADNVIAHCGRFTPEAAGVFVGDNADNQIIHNHIYDLFQCGISVGSVQDFGPHQAQGNVIEHNHIHDVGQGMLSDVAGIYTCSTPGSRIRYNRVHDVSRRDYGGWGIYPDQGSHDLLIEKNLVYRCQDGALFAAPQPQHHGGEQHLRLQSRRPRSSATGSAGSNSTCRRNLFYYQEGKAIGASGIDNSGTNVCLFDRNLYWNASGAAGPFRRQDASPNGRRRARTRIAWSRTPCSWTRRTAISG